MVVIFFAFSFVKESKEIYFIFIIYVASVVFDVTWLFYGLENFKSVVVKNFISKIASFTLIIIFVKEQNDFVIYSFIEVSILFLANISVFLSALKIIKPIKFTKKDCFEHIKPMIVLSISVVAATLYTIFDKTLLGLLSTKDNVAFYEYSNKIISIPNAFVTVIGVVLFPRACALANNEDYEGRKKYANYAYIIISFISFSSIFGLMSVGPLFANIYYGEEFSICGNVIIALSPLIFIGGIGDIIRNVFLIPQKKDVAYIVCICLNAAFNIVLSLILIPYMGIYGAVIGTISAELFGVVYQIIYCRKDIVFKDIIKATVVFTFSGLVMYTSLKLFDTYINAQSIKDLVIEVLVGAIIYSALSMLVFSLLYREYWNDTILHIKHKLSKKNKTTNNEYDLFVSKETYNNKI